MDYSDAVKKVRAEKPKENFMTISFDTGYNRRIVLPQKDGAALLALLSNAEVIQDGYSDPKRIVEVPREMCTTTFLSHQEYERYKIAGLLNLTPDEVKEMMEAANKPTPVTTP